MLALPPAQLECMAKAIYYEARGESVVGKKAVAHVILNRTKSGKFPRTPCGVIRQRGQFSIPNAKPKGLDWVKTLAFVEVLDQKDPTFGAKYFHNEAVKPRWKYKQTIKLGGHRFYK